MSGGDLHGLVEGICREAREASRVLAAAESRQKDALLAAIGLQIEHHRERIAAANRLDLEAARRAGLSGAMLDRLELTDKRLASMIRGVKEVIALPDPAGESLREWTLPNGLRMQKVRVPIGVIGIIYESRPNVTVDAAVLCLKTGNAVVLRGGKEAFESNKVLADLMRRAAVEAGFPAGIVAVLPTTDREAIPVFCGMDRYVDLMIPRGGYGLIETVVRHARMPVIKHFHGVCHVYVQEGADPDMAEKILVNAKCQRPGVCNAAETLLVDEAVAAQRLPRLVEALRENGVRVLGDAASSAILGEKLDEPESWATEYLDLVIAVRVVAGMDEALDHLEKYGSHHSDTIVTNDQAAAERFLREADSAAVYWNASTRFTDGGQFGFGAEIGISTDKIHARGPMALEELMSYKYVARGNGQILE